MSVSRDRIEKEGSNFQQRVRDQYLAIHAKDADRVVLINGEQSINKVFEDIWSAMKEKFSL
jgi:dTMP kinase